MTTAILRREFRELPIALIDEPVLPSRSTMDDEKMRELVESIRTVGLIQPINVAAVAERFEVIAGHRRRIACGQAGLAVVPCIVYPSKSAGLEAVQHAENKHREDLSAADEAYWFAELLEGRAGGDVDALCALVGEKRAHVEGLLNLLHGDEQIFKALEHSEIGKGVAQELNRCGDQLHRRMLLWQAKQNGATVAMVHGWIAEWKHVHAPATQAGAAEPSSAPAAAIPAMNFFVCRLCNKSDNVHTMQPINIHAHCYTAWFEDMLAMWERRHEFVRYPRTLEEASDLVTELADRFPMMLEQDHRRA